MRVIRNDTSVPLGMLHTCSAVVLRIKPHPNIVSFTSAKRLVCVEFSSSCEVLQEKYMKYKEFDEI